MAAKHRIRQPPPPSSPVVAPAPELPPKRWRDAAIGLALAALTAAAYWQVGRLEFVNFDDGQYVSENPHVATGLTRENVAWAWSARHASNWHPLTWLSHQLDVQVFGVRSGPHHLVNLLFHTANAVLLFLVLKRATAATWPSAAVAALFAVHPLHVESVAWVAERKDVLSTLFGLLATAAYVGYSRRPGVLRYATVFVLFALSLLAKPMLVTLPFLFLLLDYWPLGRLWPQAPATPTTTDRPATRPDRKERRGMPSDNTAGNLRAVSWLVVEKAPLLALSLASSVVTYLAQRGEAMTAGVRFTLAVRWENALLGYLAYLAKTVWPVGLAVFYPFRATGNPWAILGAGALLAVISAAVVWASRRGRRYLAVGWFWYLGTLVPVIGLIQVGQQAFADRYTYFPLVGLFLAAAWGIAELADRWPRLVRVAAPLTAAALAACVALTVRQVGYWSNGITLFEHAIEVTRDNALAHTNLAVALEKANRPEDAFAHYEEAARIDPLDLHAQRNLGLALAQRGELDRAIPCLQKAARFQPRDVEVRIRLARALVDSGKPREALSHYRAAVAIDPADAVTHNNLALTLVAVGDFEEAIAEYHEALRLAAAQPMIARNLAWLRATCREAKYRDGAEAVRWAEHACRNSPEKNPHLLDALAAAYAEAGRFEDAQAAEREAIAAASAAGLADDAESFRARLRRYEARRPYREE